MEKLNKKIKKVELENENKKMKKNILELEKELQDLDPEKYFSGVYVSSGIDENEAGKDFKKAFRQFCMENDIPQEERDDVDGGAFYIFLQRKIDGDDLKWAWLKRKIEKAAKNF